MKRKDAAPYSGPPLVALSGQITAANAGEVEIIRRHLPRHVSLSRAEAGCLRFDAIPTDDPFVWQVDELFIDDAAFLAHQTRTRASEWWQASHAIRRDFERMAAEVTIREETAADHPAALSLLAETFDGVDEARLVQMLREDGDLTLSLVADAAGTILGQIGFSPISGTIDGLALAPLAVTPRLQGRGIGQALVREALARARDRIVVVLGKPEYYARFGFRPVAWESPYSGPFLQAIGPNLPRDAKIDHAPAFGALG